MSIESIRANVQCDSCGSAFQVDLGPAYAPPAGWSLWDVAQDAVRGGYVHGKSIFDGSCSVQNSQALCIPCTREADTTGATDDHD